MGIIIDSKKTSIYVEGGYGEADFSINNAILMQIFVNVPTTTNTFDIYITDEEGFETYRRNNVIGTLNELTMIPVYGNQILTIENATVDEEFEVRLNYRRS